MKGGPQTWGEEKPVSVEKACISLDGTCIAALFVDGTLCIYDTTTGEEILSPFKVDEYPRSVVFSPDGKLVTTGGRALRLWDVLTGEEVESFNIDVFSLAFSPDGTRIAAGCEGRIKRDGREGSYNIRVINLESAKNPHPPHHFISSRGESILLLKGEVWPSPFEGHEMDVLSLSYSADGQQIASCSMDRTIRVWDVSTGSRRTISTSYFNYSVAFSPDGTQIASNGILYNLISDTRHTFADSGQAHSFSADGRFIASGSSGGACQIWDASTDETIQLVGHRGDVKSVAFFPDGKQMMSASTDGTIRLWDVELLKEGGEMDGWKIDWDLVEMGFTYSVRSPEGECLFRPQATLPFRHTRNTLVIGECPTIDFSNFVYGAEWVKCREPL